MKKPIFALILTTALIPGLGNAEDHKDYSICRVAGYYDGDDNRFLYDLASRVVDKNHLSTDSGCTLAMKIGKDVAIKFAKPGKAKTEEDGKVLEEAAHFSNLIYDAILSRVKFD